MSKLGSCDLENLEFFAEDILWDAELWAVKSLSISQRWVSILAPTLN